MGTVHTGRFGIIVTEVEVSRQFLPRCANCHAPHPLARKPKAIDGQCPDCGEPTQKGQIMTQRAFLNFNGIWGVIAKFCFRIAQFLTGLAKGV